MVVKHIHYLLAFSIIALASCSTNCGMDDIIYYSGAEINNFKDTIEPTDGIYRHELGLKHTVYTEPGKKNKHCRTKVYRTEIGERVDTSSIKVYCDKDLHNGSNFIAAGGNMLERGDMFSFNADGSFTLPGTIRLELDSTQRGSYTYYISGTTDKGNNFIDSTAVYYQ